MHHDPFCSIGSTWSWWSIGVFTDLRSFRLSCENASPTARLAPPSRTSILMLWTGFKRTKRRPRPNRCHERREGKLIGAWQVEAEIPSICAKVRFLVTRMVAGTRKSVRPWRSRLGRVGTNSGDTDVGAQHRTRRSITASVAANAASYPRICQSLSVACPVRLDAGFASLMAVSSSHAVQSIPSAAVRLTVHGSQLTHALPAHAAYRWR